jgi:hypothetical protein
MCVMQNNTVSKDLCEIGNSSVRVVASVAQPKLSLSLLACGENGVWRPILERSGKNLIEDNLGAELPENCTLETEQVGDTSFLIIQGTCGQASHIIQLRIDAHDPWVSVYELLILDELASSIGVNWFEAEWKFSGWQEPGEVFSPLLVPQPDDVIGQHVMRSPALTAQCDTRTAALVNDVDSIAKIQALPACMNLLRDAGTPIFRTGLRGQQVRDHVYFRYTSAAAHQARFHHSYQLYVSATAQPGAATTCASHRLWEAYGARSLKAAPPLQLGYADYARQVYPRMLDLLWAESKIGDKRVGSIRVNRSYPNDIWMCTWFNPARTAYGMYLWGKWLNNDDWMARAVATRDLYLSAPQDHGLFPTVFVFEGRSADDPHQFAGGRWVHSHHQGGGLGLYRPMDMSWSAYQLLRWQRDLAPAPETIPFVRNYCKGILALQREDGGLPTLVDASTFSSVTYVDPAPMLKDLAEHPGGDTYIPHMFEHAWVPERYERSAEDAASLLLLAEFAQQLPANDPDRPTFIHAAERIAGWLENWVFPESRWIDYEVYYSCSPKPVDFYDQRSGQWPQNTLCMHLAAAGLLALYEVTQQKHYLDLATHILGRLMLYQQVWDPPFLNFYGFGGYGVMNTDGEWDDGRQAQFADTHLDFFRATGNQEQLERAIAACRAGFTTVYLPSNAPVYPTGWCRQPRGIAAENHAHGGSDHLCGVSGFDWGIGSALATAAYLRLHGGI